MSGEETSKAVQKYLLVTFLITIIVIALVSTVRWLWVEIDTPYQGFLSQQQLVLISPGMSVSTISERLEKRGIIPSAQLFRWYLRATKKSSNLMAGEYEFRGPASMVEVAEKLCRGDIYYHRLTIPEGLDFQQVAQKLASLGFGKEEEFLRWMSDPAPIRDLDPEAENLEGYLFPETYFLTRGTSEKQIVLTLVRHFREFWEQIPSPTNPLQQLKLREIVTLASLVEKETALPEERKLVAGVFYNRLNLQMKLACDPTVIYAVKRVKEYDGIIHKSDLELDSPYNTYLYPGLPPGPIANPGRESLLAALFPSETDYLFFVSKNDGSHYFSTQYSQHHRAVLQYQR